MKKDASFWSEHALTMDLPLPHQQHHMGDIPLDEKTPKKRRRKKEDKGDKPDKGTGKKRGRKPKSSKLGSAGTQDPGGTPTGDYVTHDWNSKSRGPPLTAGGVSDMYADDNQVEELCLC